jgi:hypothetical protein
MISGPKFEPGTFGIRNRSVNHSAKAFDMCFKGKWMAILTTSLTNNIGYMNTTRKSTSLPTLNSRFALVTLKEIHKEATKSDCYHKHSINLTVLQ